MSEGYDDSLIKEGAHTFFIDGLTKAACAASLPFGGGAMQFGKGGGHPP